MSRQKSGRGAKPAAAPKGRSAGRGAATAPRGGRGVYVQAPKSDIFVVLLSISLGAILIGCILLLLVWKDYDFSTSVSALSNTPQNGSTLRTIEDLNKNLLLAS